MILQGACNCKVTQPIQYFKQVDSESAEKVCSPQRLHSFIIQFCWIFLLLQCHWRLTSVIVQMPRREKVPSMLAVWFWIPRRGSTTGWSSCWTSTPCTPPSSRSTTSASPLSPPRTHSPNCLNPAQTWHHCQRYPIGPTPRP